MGVRRGEAAKTGERAGRKSWQIKRGIMNTLDTGNPRRNMGEAWRRARAGRLVHGLGMFVMGISAAVLFAGSLGAQVPAVSLAAGGFPANFKGIEGWTPSGPPVSYLKDGLRGYLGTGADLFLEYGFKRLTVFTLAPQGAPAQGGKELTLEIFEMQTPEGAFGIYANRRAGDEYFSPLLKTVHWIGNDRANLVKGLFYVNLRASGCTKQEVEDATLALDRVMPPAAGGVPLDVSWLPQFNFLPRTENYVMGEQAALALWPFFSGSIWGFGEGGTTAFSVKYGQEPSSELVVLYFPTPTPNIKNDVLKFFSDYLSDAALIEDLAQGRGTNGEYYVFGQYGNTGVLILGDPNAAAARARVQKALDALKRKAEAEKQKKVPAA